MADDLAILCCTSATADKKTIGRRFEHEGLSFLTITLPDLGKATQKWLDQGQAGIHPSFTTGRGSLPLFLGGFFNRVFDRSSGALLDKPCVDSIYAIRQLTLGFAKMEIPCSDARVRKAMQDYVECEKDVRKSDARLTEVDLSEFQRISDLLFRGVFAQMDRDVYYGHIRPKHGPGGTADGLTGNGKFNQLTWTARLDRVFPLDKYLIPNHHFTGVLEKVNVLEPGAEIPVKVIPVPKTLKTPRIIAMEPTCMQYMQQGLLRSFLAAFSRDELLGRLIGFVDQGPNQLLAQQGSADGRTATLDLSEASDRVSNQLVRRMVSRWPHLSEAIDATRSRRAFVPGHGEVRLAKFASMGSALCFPMEAMVFTTLIFLGIQKSLNVTLSRELIESLSGSVRVYGDDLIVPVDHVRTIVQTLEHFGARVGLHKSFWTGKFRESCGKEYFDGQDVSIVKVRQALPTTMADVTEVISTVALRNLLWFPSVVDWLDNLLTGILKHFPKVGPASPVLGRVSSRPDQGRMHPYLFSPQVRGYVVQAKAPADMLEDYGALLKCLLKLENDMQGNADSCVSAIPSYRPGTVSVGQFRRVVENQPYSSPSWAPPMSQDEKHLERTGRPKRVSIKLGWWPAV